METVVSVNWSAVGSIAAAVIVLINLYLLFIKPRWERPRLNIEFGMRAPFCRETISGKFRSTDPKVTVPTYWVRVRIRNSGKATAKSCLGKVTEVMDSDGKVMDEFDPTQMHWVTTDWGRVSFATLDLGGRGDYEYIDLLAVQANDDKAYICGDQFEWAHYPPRGLRNYLEPGKYVIRFVVYAENAESAEKYLSLVWGGRAIEDIIAKAHDNLDEARDHLQQPAEGIRTR
jgi:hypothetical protein